MDDHAAEDAMRQAMNQSRHAEEVERAFAQEIELTFGVPHWSWKRVQNQTPAQGQSAAARRASFKRRLSHRSMRKPIEVVLTFRGGPECWVQAEARGRTFRFPGYVSVYEVLQRLNGW